MWNLLLLKVSTLLQHQNRHNAFQRDAFSKQIVYFPFLSSISMENIWWNILWNLTIFIHVPPWIFVQHFCFLYEGNKCENVITANNFIIGILRCLSIWNNAVKNVLMLLKNASIHLITKLESHSEKPLNSCSNGAHARQPIPFPLNHNNVHPIVVLLWLHCLDSSVQFSFVWTVAINGCPCCNQLEIRVKMRILHSIWKVFNNFFEPVNQLQLRFFLNEKL